MVEVVRGVVRAGSRLGVVLNAEHRALPQAQALDHAVVEVDVTDRRRAVRGVEWLQGPGGHVGPGAALARFRGNVALPRQRGGEAVIVAGDVDPAGGEVHDRLVHAAVPVPQLVGAQAERQGEDLAAQADAEDGPPGVQHPAHRVHRVRGRGRVAGAVAEEHPVRLGRQDLVGAGGGGHHQHLAAPGREVARRGGLDAQVDGDHAVPGRPFGADRIGLGRAHHPGQVRPGHLRAGQHPLQKPFRAGLHRADGRPHGALLADPPGQHPGAAYGDAGHALGPEVGVQVPRRPPAGGEPGRLAHHVAADPDPPGFGVFVVDAGVADVRGGHGDDLAAVRGVGQRLLVSGHAGVEDHLAERLALRAEGGAVQRGAILKHQQGASFGHLRRAFRRAR